MNYTNNNEQSTKEESGVVGKLVWVAIFLFITVCHCLCDTPNPPAWAEATTIIFDLGFIGLVITCIFYGCW